MADAPFSHDYRKTVTHVSGLFCYLCTRIGPFEFLLQRESNTSILSSFELPVIGRYFPEYEDEIRRMLG
jgi:hypothetical protein